MWVIFIDLHTNEAELLPPDQSGSKFLLWVMIWFPCSCHLNTFVYSGFHFWPLNPDILCLAKLELWKVMEEALNYSESFEDLTSEPNKAVIKLVQRCGQTLSWRLQLTYLKYFRVHFAPAEGCKGLGVGLWGSTCPLARVTSGVLQLPSFGIMMAHVPFSSGLLLSLLTRKQQL